MKRTTVEIGWLQEVAVAVWLPLIIVGAFIGWPWLSVVGVALIFLAVLYGR